MLASSCAYSNMDLNFHDLLLERQIKAYVGISTQVRVLASGSIERTQTGKAKRVIDKRPK